MMGCVHLQVYRGAGLACVYKTLVTALAYACPRFGVDCQKCACCYTEGKVHSKQQVQMPAAFVGCYVTLRSRYAQMV